MKTRFHISTLLGLAAVSLLATDGFAAGGKQIVASKDLLQPTDHDSPIGIQAVVLTTGFEVANGFAVGPVEPQNGFTASGVNSAWSSISAVNPCLGAQHLRLVRDAAVGAGTQRLVFTPNIPQPANTPSQVKMLINISNDEGADYDVAGQAPSQMFLTWRVKFSFSGSTGAEPGTIFVLDDVGAGLAFQDTGVLWLEGQCAELKVQHDPGLGVIRYFYNNVLIYTGIVFAGTSVEQLVWITDNFQLGGETAGFDGLSWIDTPSDPVPATNASWGKIKNQYR